MSLPDPTTVGRNIGISCLTLLEAFTPDSMFESTDEALRFRFGAGMVILTLAKDIARFSTPYASPTPPSPQFISAFSEAVEKPFVTMVKSLDVYIPDVDAVKFLPDESEQDLFCQYLCVSKQELAASSRSTALSIFLSVVYSSRERLYFSDLRAASEAAAKITDGLFSAVGEMVFVYKRFMLHAYGLKSNMRNRFVEEPLAAKGFRAAIVFNESYSHLCPYIKRLFGMTASS